MKYTYHTVHALLATIGMGALFAVPLVASATITSSLDIGASGGQVTELQQFLAQDPSIYPEGLVTGYYGSLTQAAVERYQCQNGIVCSGSPETTGYGRVGPSTMAAINTDMGTSDSGGGTPTTADVYAPIMSTDTIATTSTSATITWTTNENAHSRVMYGTHWPFLYATAPFVSDSNFDKTQAVTLSGLTPNTTYHFVRESVDANGNIMWTVNETFSTGS